MRITTKQMIEVQLAAIRSPNSTTELLQQVAEIHERVKVFEAAVWFPRLQAVVNGTDARGMSGECRGVKVMTWCCAGRCLITMYQLERADATLSLITADDEAPWSWEMAHVAPSMGPMGIQSINAEYLDTLAMLYTVTRWAEELTLTPNAAVTIGG